MERLSRPDAMRSGPPRSLPADRGPIPALTGIRAVAAVWVVLFHFRAELVELLPGLSPLLPLAAAGRLGVDLFFILSGFILAYNYADRFRTVRLGDYGRFLWLRLARIYPVHLFTLGALVGIVFGAKAVGLPVNPPEMYTIPTLIANVLMVNAWTGMQLSWNYPAWSISAEWFAYLLFPLIGWALTRIRRTSLALAGSAVALASMYAVFLLFPTGWPFPVPLVRIGAEFVVGSLLCVVYRSRLGRDWNWPLIGGVALVGSMAVGTWLEVSGRQAIWVVPGLAIVILALARADRGVLQRWLSSKHMIYLGEVSYALYMTHAICQLVLAHLLPEAAFSAGLATRLCIVVGYAVVLLATAIAVYHFVEEPSRRWMRRRLPT